MTLLAETVRPQRTAKTAEGWAASMLSTVTKAAPSVKGWAAPGAMVTPAAGDSGAAGDVAAGVGVGAGGEACMAVPRPGVEQAAQGSVRISRRSRRERIRQSLSDAYDALRHGTARTGHRGHRLHGPTPGPRPHRRG